MNEICIIKKFCFSGKVVFDDRTVLDGRFNGNDDPCHIKSSTTLQLASLRMEASIPYYSSFYRLVFICYWK